MIPAVYFSVFFSFFYNYIYTRYGPSVTPKKGMSQLDFGGVSPLEIDFIRTYGLTYVTRLAHFSSWCKGIFASPYSDEIDFFLERPPVQTGGVFPAQNRF